MTKKIFVRIFLFGTVAVAATAVLVAAICAISFGSTDDIGQLLLKTLPYIAIVLFGVLLISFVIGYAITKSIVKPIEKLGENLDNIDNVKTYKELQPFIQNVKAQNDKKKLLDKQKKQFTANVSHELKTPLTSIAGYAELIESGIAKPDDVRPFAHTIRKQALRLVSLAEDIIKLSQLEEGDNKIVFEEVDISAVAADCVESLSMMAQMNDITLNFNSSEKIYIKANKSLIEELLYNLCDNAIRYNKKGGQVNISIDTTPSENIILSVADTGIGIADKYKDRIFERFFRVDKSRSKETGGTGLGLAIVKHICEVHNAKINIDSVYDKGTTITISFDKLKK